jgi:hypothetical protein
MKFFLAYFPYFEKIIKAGLCYNHPLCMSVYFPHPNSSWMPEPIFMKLGMAHETISTAR